MGRVRPTGVQIVVRYSGHSQSGFDDAWERDEKRQIELLDCVGLKIPNRCPSSLSSAWAFSIK